MQGPARIAEGLLTDAQRPLGFHEGMTIVAGWDKGFLHEPNGSEKIAQLNARRFWHPFALTLSSKRAKAVLDGSKAYTRASENRFAK